MRGVGCFRQGAASATGYQGFPSPCGVWVVSAAKEWISKLWEGVSVPLRGVGCFRQFCNSLIGTVVSVPLRGVGCFMGNSYAERVQREFPSPCGVWVVSLVKAQIEWVKEFPSPCGVWVVSIRGARKTGEIIRVSVPLRGVGCFRQGAASATGYQGFPSPCGVWVVSTCRCATGRRSGVSVPLRGVGCFQSLL